MYIFNSRFKLVLLVARSPCPVIGGSGFDNRPRYTKTLYSKMVPDTSLLSAHHYKDRSSFSLVHKMRYTSCEAVECE